MQDYMGQFREYLMRSNPSALSALIQGPSLVFDTQQNAFDVEAQMGLDTRKDLPPDELMGGVLTAINSIKNGIASIQESMNLIRTLKSEAIHATSPEDEKAISEKLSDLLSATNKTSVRVKKELEVLKKENEAFSAKHGTSSEAKIRENLHAVVTRKFRDLLKEYQTLQTDFKKHVRDKVSRQILIVFPEASEDEVAKIVDEGDSAAATAIRLRISGQTHESLQNALGDIQDKYKDIRRLEKSVGELHQMFLDLSVLVEAQGELLDQIDYSVNSAKDYTEKGEKELISARKDQKRAQRRWCCISTCLIIVLILIALPLIIVFTGK